MSRDKFSAMRIRITELGKRARAIAHTFGINSTWARVTHDLDTVSVEGGTSNEFEVVSGLMANVYGIPHCTQTSCTWTAKGLGVVQLVRDADYKMPMVLEFTNNPMEV